MIIQHPSEKPTKPSIDTDTAAAGPTHGTLPCQDLTKVGLASVSERLRASRADLGEVFEARARADVVYCPVCPEPHRIA